jgi:hypothetical protein
MIFALTSCSPQKKPVPKAKDKKEENKPPKELDDLSKAIEKIEKALMEMHESSKKPLFMQQEEIQKKAKKEGGQEQQSKQEGGGGSSSGGSSGGQQGGQGGQSSEVDIVTPEAQKMETALELQKMKIEIEKANRTQFEQFKKDTMELHGLWNAYESKAVALIMTQTTIKDFEDSLNALTKSIDNENVFQSLLDVTQLYKYLPDFYLTYTAKSPPEIGKIKFAAKKIQLLSEKKDFKGAKEVLEYLKVVWMQTRPKLNEKSKDMINQIEFATSDLNDAIEVQDHTIVKAKTEIILKVSEKLEKTNEKEEEKK